MRGATRRSTANGALFLALLIILCTAKVLHSQPIEKNRDYFRLTGGIGLDGTAAYAPGVSFLASMAYQSRHNLYSIGLTAYTEVRGDVTPEWSLLSAELLYGYGTTFDLFFLSCSAGLSYNNYNERGRHLADSTRPGSSEILLSKFETVVSTGVGIPIQLQAIFTPTPILGIGLVGSANLNTRSTAFSIALCLQVGWF